MEPSKESLPNLYDGRLEMTQYERTSLAANLCEKVVGSGTRGKAGGYEDDFVEYR